MIEYTPASENDDIFERTRAVSVQNDGKLSLTQLWEVILRTKRLPDGFDVNALYSGVRERLRDPELEVRQHALRVLIDLIPVTQTTSLDDHMRTLVPELHSNLGHPAPALRKSALDTLRIYLRHSKNYDELLKQFISSTAVENNVIAAAPFLISPSTSNDTLRHVIDQLWKEIHSQNYHQEIAAKSLARIRYSLGDERFKMLIGTERFNELQKICDSYGLPIDYSDGDISEEEATMKDKVILETEITLRTGPAITMKIHEESRDDGVNGNSMGDSDDEARQNMGVIKVLRDDSESDYYEMARRTPRKVRFGGEQVKMRTPESDSSNQDDSRSTIRITVTDAVSIKTRRSLIPVRITSLPSTPRKTSPSTLVKPRLHQSTPNLTRSNSISISRIPLKKGTNIKVSAVAIPETVKDIPKDIPKDKPKDIPKEQPSTSESTTLPVKSSRELLVRRNSRADDDLSPTPIHNEIEVFHNLTRSPDRQRKSPSPQPIKDREDQEDKKAITYNSFQVCQENGATAEENSGQSSKENYEGESREEVKPLYLHQPFQISSISTEDEFWNKSETLDNLIKMLKQLNTCESLEPGPAALLFEALFACQSLDKLHFLADDALALLVKGLRPNVLEQCLGRLALGICKVGAPSGVSLALMIMKKCPAKKLQLEIIDRCFAHRTREGALQCLMAAARLLPSNEVEVNKIAEFASSALRDRRRRVRHAALETLASLAQLTSNLDILDVVNRITETFQDHQYLLRVVRMRLSRRQLPSVEMDGTVRYSTPREQAELEWLSGITIPSSPSSPPSSSASSSTPSVNYWKRNSRHTDGNALTLNLLSSQDESTNGNQQIWAVDSSVFPKINNLKDSGKANGTILRPVYVLQPEAVRIAGRGHRRYDRGRSFSPPKPGRGPFQDVAGSAPHNTDLNAQRQIKECEGFRKSFSSEQLYYTEKPHHEPYSFSLSSRSSTTSTGSSTRSGIWQRDIRSGIPVPISSETKLKLRINNSNNNSNIGVGPVIARRNGKVVDISLASKQSTPVLAITLPPEPEEKSALGSPIQSPVVGRSPRENGSATHANIPPPPRSSGSESSGYFTPPPEIHQAFVKLDTEEHASESEEIMRVNDDNNNTPDCVDSINNNSPNLFITEHAIQRTFSPSSMEASDREEDKEVKSIEISESVINNNLEREERRLHRFSSSSLRDPSFTGKMPPVTDNRTKSKSVVDLQNFLPDIAGSRKTVNSAPPFNDETTDIIVVSNVEEIPISPMKPILPVAAEPVKELVQKLESPKEGTCTRKLSKRFSRTQSRKSIKSTPRSVRETTPQSSRPSSKPKEVLQQALAQLNSGEWEITIQGLQALAKITRQHPDTIEAQIHTVCVSLARHIKNLRSQVARSACHTASELFSTCKKGLDIELEEIAGPLLHRTADTNKFLRADANSALDVMCVQLPTNRVIAVVTGRGCTHQNSIVRSAAMRLINDIVQQLGADKVFQMPKEIKDKILFSGANCLMDGSLETRSHAKAMFSHLIGHPQFHRALLDAVPQSTLRHIAKTLSLIKPHPT